MKKILTLVLALMLIVSCMSAMAASDEHITFSSANWRLTSSDANYTDDAFYTYMSEKFNVTFEPWITDASSHDEKCAIWINTFSMPDVLVHTSFNYATYCEWVDQGMLAPLPEGWKETYPNIAKIIEKSMIEDYLTIDGQVYGIPATVFANYLDMEIPVGHTCVYYRVDWAEQLGIEIGDSITLSQLREYCEKAIEADLAGNGNTHGISGTAKDIADPIMSMSGVDYDSFYKLEDGATAWGPTADGVTDRIAILRDLYADGIIHPDSFTMTSNEMYAVFQSGLSAAHISAGGPGNHKEVCMGFEKANPGKLASDCIASTVLADDDGTVYSSEGTNFWTVKYFNPDIDPDVQARILEIIDWCCNPEDGQLEAYYGIKGVDWDFNEEGKMYSLTGEAVSYPSLELVCVWGTCSDELYYVDSTDLYPHATANVAKNYEVKGEGVIIPYNYDYKYYNSDAKSVYSVDVASKIIELMVDSSLDIETEWQNFIDTNEGMWKPLLDELNAQ